MSSTTLTIATGLAYLFAVTAVVFMATVFVGLLVTGAPDGRHITGVVLALFCWFVSEESHKTVQAIQNHDTKGGQA